MSVKEADLVRLVGPLKKAVKAAPETAPVKKKATPESIPPSGESMTKATSASPNLLDFNPQDVLRGILYAEIIGKPRSLSRRRR